MPLIPITKQMMMMMMPLMIIVNIVFGNHRYGNYHGNDLGASSEPGSEHKYRTTSTTLLMTQIIIIFVVDFVVSFMRRAAASFGYRIPQTQDQTNEKIIR